MTDVATPALPRREGREGNRWVNHQPSLEELSEWFAKIPIHDGMKHEDWVTGLTLIRQTEKTDEIAGFREDNRPIIIPEVQHTYFIPYPKVEARIAYFNTYWQLDDGHIGFIEPVVAPDSGGMADGFNPMKISLPDGKIATLLCYSAIATIFERDGLETEEREDVDGKRRWYNVGTVVQRSAVGTKAVPILNQWGKVDADAPAKAQSGAIGRALGMMGMLVIPGTGVATAEDMREMTEGGSPHGAPATQEGLTTGGAQASEAGSDDSIRERIAELHGQLREYPDHMRIFSAWAKERGYGNIAEIGGTNLKGIQVKLERELDRAVRSAQSATEVDIDLDADAPAD